MRFLTTVAAAALILGSANAAFAARAYIGTYTRIPPSPRGGSNHGEGIYLADIDEPPARRPIPSWWPRICRRPGSRFRPTTSFSMR
jgi:hypothetical protein